MKMASVESSGIEASRVGGLGSGTKDLETSKAWRRLGMRRHKSRRARRARGFDQFDLKTRGESRLRGMVSHACGVCKRG